MTERMGGEAAGAAVPGPGPADRRRAVGSGTRRILIVDDDPTIVQLLSDVLTDAGYEVAAATQSLRAFDRAKEFGPDLILMDIMMPYLDGLDQLRLFSLDRDLKEVP